MLEACSSRLQTVGRDRTGWWGDDAPTGSGLVAMASNLVAMVAGGGEILDMGQQD